MERRFYYDSVVYIYINTNNFSKEHNSNPFSVFKLIDLKKRMDDTSVRYLTVR